MDGYPEIFEIHTHKDSKISNGSERFHSDVSCDEEPPLGTMLQLHILPETVEIQCLLICTWLMTI